MKKILFFSSTEFGKEILDVLDKSDYKVVGVVTRSDKVRGRGNKVLSTPVKTLALDRGINVYERDYVTDEDIGWIKSLDVDYFVVVAYGAIIPQNILDIPKIAPINIHASILPKYRGASPIESVILKGEKETGISYMHMTKKLDAGDIYKIYKIEIQNNEIFDTLNEKLCELSKNTVVDVLNGISDGNLKRVAQSDDATYVGKILKSDAEIDFNNTAEVVKNKINALDSHIGAFAFINDNRYKLFGAEISNQKLDCGVVKVDNGIYIGTQDYAVKIKYIQAPGKKKMLSEDFLRGNTIEGKFEVRW